MSAQRPAICMMGPTGAGKTAAAVALVQHGRYEIISVDSGMVYRGLDIGTAKPGPVVLARAPHRLIDILNPDEHYSAAQFREHAQIAIDEILAAGRIPLLVGGTGLYFRALFRGLSRLPGADPAIRERLAQERLSLGSEAQHARLRQIDPEAAARIHCNDPQRIHRALEVYEITGTPISELQNARLPTRDGIRWVKIGLFPHDRPALSAQLAARFQDMLSRGLINEVRAIRGQYPPQAQLPGLKLVGYREIVAYLDALMDLQEAERRATQATRQLAKRQLTWLRSEPDIRWFSCENKQLTNELVKFLVRETDG